MTSLPPNGTGRSGPETQAGSLVKVDMTAAERDEVLHMISHQMALPQGSACQRILDDVLRGLSQSSGSEKRVNPQRVSFRYSAIRVATMVRCRELKDEAQRQAMRTNTKKWWEQAEWWNDELFHQLLGELGELLDVSSMPLRVQLLEEVFSLLGEDGVDAQDPIASVRQFVQAFEEEVMFGEKPFVEHEFLRGAIVRSLRLESVPEREAVQSELQMRVEIFFESEGNFFAQLIFRTLEELLDEMREQVQTRLDNTRFSVFVILQHVGLAYDDLDATRDNTSDQWLTRVARSYRGAVITMEHAATLCEYSKTWVLKTLKRITSQSRRRILKERVRTNVALTQVQVRAAIENKKGDMTRDRAITLLKIKSGKDAPGNLSSKIDKRIRPQFARWFEIADAPLVRKRPSIFSGPLPEHVPFLQRRIAHELSDEQLMDKLGIPRENPTVLRTAITAIKKAFPAEFDDRICAAGGRSDAEKLKYLRRYDAGGKDEAAIILKELKLGSSASLTSTMYRWRNQMRSKGLYPLESDRDS